mmetsp:Transcript_20667/g.25570  ORF Transcript_20667/g.25570 Transcript_20667/m.25570 type:complete len:637 (-) Transcript_20667:171-2081(-)|eukprot:CAMPEP_0172515758 /NCGR_PEP_ID=MMETSP1066-20121228/270333_1 /TAXON_ID=671091 /ORGANISM="Coscinodiscus wailesii, Strain CCMP2513" /LENGTH=636 /DNA_ID=CAMNT_0013296925 /DNA_START=166 /DNA_END=2076 /DNA_ORIENTATION=-
MMEEVDRSRCPTTSAKCQACGHLNCDVLMVGCGCMLHARCTPLPATHSLNQCPICHTPAKIYLFPLTATTPTPTPRTGRWTPEELTFVDELICHFEAGTLPLPSQTKLHDFLSGILQCKPSRLTKKLKKAKLCSRSYIRTSGHVCVSGGVKNSVSAQGFSRLQELFLKSVGEARKELSQNLSRHWRELFSNYCVERGQPVDASDWLSSVEELEKRDSMQKAKGKCLKRRVRMGYAMRKDKAKDGVFVEDIDLFDGDLDEEEEKDLIGSLDWDAYDADASAMEHNGNYLPSIMEWIEKENLPFQYADMWVPSYLSSSTELRLCFAGCATRNDLQKPSEVKSLAEFGQYSKKFSFDTGHGLPGRVYKTGIPNWEQSVQLAPSCHFARCGGAAMYGVKTVLGIPVVSQTVGKIVVALYSINDVPKDEHLVTMCKTQFNKYLPNPQWKLVIDAGMDTNTDNSYFLGMSQDQNPQPNKRPRIEPSNSNTNLDARQDQYSSNKHQQSTKESIENSEIIKILGEHMPLDNTNPAELHGFMTLRLLLLRSKTMISAPQEEMLNILKSSYRGYKSVNRKVSDVALLLAKDCAFLMQSYAAQISNPPPRNVSFSSQPSSPTLQSTDSSMDGFSRSSRGSLTLISDS